MRSAFRLFLLGLVAVSFLTIGCGEDRGKVAGDEADTADTTGATETAEIGRGADGSYSVAEFRKARIAMNRELVEIAGSIETVEDAEKAEPKIEQAMSNMAGMYIGLAGEMEKMSTTSLREFAGLPNISSDPEVLEWNRKVDSAMMKLAQEHPDVAAKLNEIGERNHRRWMQPMQSAQMKINQIISGTATPPDTGSKE